MIDPYFVAKWLHVLGSTVLFGTGIGTAYFMWTAHRSGDARVIAAVAGHVVRADWIFTLGSGIAQPATGAWLIWTLGYDPTESWLVVGYVLYAVALGCWIPVVWLQVRARDLAREAVANTAPLTPAYRRCMAWWFALGWPAFFALMAVFALMIAKPALW